MTENAPDTGVHVPPAPTIVVGVDGSEASKNALHWAARLAPSLGAQLDVVTAWSAPSASYGPMPFPQGVNPHLFAEKIVRSTVISVFGTDAPAGVTLRTAQGHPAQVLINSSDNAVMIVIGSRGHGSIASALLGAVSAQVGRHAHCPVLIVHGHDVAEAAEPATADPAAAPRIADGTLAQAPA